MRQTNQFSNHLRVFKTTRAKVAIFAVLAIAALAGFFLPGGALAANLPTNDPSNIVSGGFSSPTAVVNAYKAKTPSDIQPIYNAFGLQTADLSNFQANATAGTLKSDGTLVVNGQVVGNNAKALGRLGPNAGYQQTTPMTIAGKTYYTTPLSYILSFHKQSSTSAYVLMNGSTPKFTVMADCGNPVSVTPVATTQPTYKCNMLNASNNGDNTYTFTTDVTADNGASLQKVVYDFGDGSPTVTQTSAAAGTAHTYGTPGTYTAKATAYFTAGGQTFTKDCQKQITIPQPTPTPPTPTPAPLPVCKSPLGSVSVTRTEYEFTANAQPGSGATFKSADFDFGDKQTATNLAPTSLNTVTVRHNFTTPGNYAIKATLNFDTTGDTTTTATATCSTNITVAQATTTSTVTSTTTTPTQLPSTGPSEIIGGGLGLGSIVTAGGYYFRSRRDVLKTIFKR